MFGYAPKLPALAQRIPAGVSSAEFIRKHVSVSHAALLRPDIHHDYVACALEHYWTSSCGTYALQLFLGELSRSAKLYMPLNVVG